MKNISFHMYFIFYNCYPNATILVVGTIIIIICKRKMNSIHIIVIPKITTQASETFDNKEIFTKKKTFKFAQHSHMIQLGLVHVWIALKFNERKKSTNWKILINFLSNSSSKISLLINPHVVLNNI